MSESTNTFIERVLAWRLPDRARLDDLEGDERALEDPPGDCHGQIGGSGCATCESSQERRQVDDREARRRRAIGEFALRCRKGRL